MTDFSTLPPIPWHPEAHSMTWTKLELACLRKYGEQCFAAGSAEGAALEVQAASDVAEATRPDEKKGACRLDTGWGSNGPGGADVGATPAPFPDLTAKD